ncbi:MAG: Rne/Rng family ribonuclease [Candidatus Gastranaerophilales bacterium]|nr:Rne/Rng family ribonuclease [Candidatus Gastranaerophilales bacterium]
MTKSIIISERDNIGAVIENGKVSEFFVQRGDILLNDVYLATVENILPSIDAAFVNVGSDKMGFLHASDVVGKGSLEEKLKPKQRILVQVVKEPTGHKGPRVTMSISLPGRFLVLMPDEKGINVSKKIESAKERARLKSVVSLLKPAGLGVIIRTEAEGQSESEIQEDLELLLEKWNDIVTATDTVNPPALVARDQDLLYKIIRESCSEDTDEIVVDTSFALHRTNQLLQSWNMNQNINVSVHKGNDSLLVNKGIDKEIKTALQTKVNLPCGGYLFIQQTEALTVIDVNSGKFTSGGTQNETIRKTNLESIDEIARQLKLRNIGGMIIVDFIDMDNRADKIKILEYLEEALEPDKSRPQVGQISDLGLVELTRHRQGQSLQEIFSKKCPACNGTGYILDAFNFASSPAEGEYKAKGTKIKLTSIKPQNNNDNKKQNHKNSQQQVQEPQAAAEEPKKQTKIETSPSLNASLQKTQNKKEQTRKFVFNQEVIKTFIGETGVMLPLANIVRSARIPVNTVNNKFPHWMNRDTFMKLTELETVVANPNLTAKIKTHEGKVEALKAEKAASKFDLEVETPDQQKKIIKPRKTTSKPRVRKAPSTVKKSK